MDVYTVYLSTFRYVMNADPSAKHSWYDIMKYLPSLRRMLACSVCGNILRNPHGAANGVCLHHVCYKCIGGKMMLKPSCSWCKDHSCFKENKKLRVLILCFKRLCAYISHSRLGTAIRLSALNGHDTEVENTQRALREAEQLEDDYDLTPPPVEPLDVLKKKVKEHNFTFSEYKPTASTSGLVRKQNSYLSSNPPNKIGFVQKKSGTIKKSLSAVSLKSSPKTNASIHVKKLKRKALSTSRRKVVATKSRNINNNRGKAPEPLRERKRLLNTQSVLLISQRPHRQLSGKFSVGQLWRETFLEERSPEPEVYPDSGIEVGNSSDQDHGSHSPNSATQQGTEQMPSSSSIVISHNEKTAYPIRDTRLHPIPVESRLNDIRPSPITIIDSQNSMSSTKLELSHPKPKLMLKVPKKRFEQISSRGTRGTILRNIVEEEGNLAISTHLLRDNKKPHSPSKYTGPGIRTRIKDSLKQRKDICRCARFKQPNQLTCFGQKCPCYRDKKPCVNCMCNGCKNPRHPSSDSAPPLMHMSKNTKESQCLSPDLELSMPRLSPIPRI